MLERLGAQRRAFIASQPEAAAARIDRIDRALALLVDNQHRLADSMSEDFGNRSIAVSRFSDIMGSVASLKHARKHVKTWMKPERRPLEFPLGLLGARGWVEYQPKGVAGIIAPWNFPVAMVFQPLAGALAAGCRAMIKPSEFTPATSALMKELVAAAFAADEIAVFTGGPEVGKAFASLPFDHLLFTGATEIGRHVMRAAAENLVPVTLELGGKSPVIIGRSADIDKAADRIAIGKLMNAGQICLAPDYLLVPREKEGAIAERLAAKAAAMYPRLADNPDYTAIVNARHRERLEGYLADARAKGADIHVVNPAGEDLSAANANKMPLHILRHVSDEMKVMREEIFGPLLPLMGYDKIDDAIAYVNARPRPLGLYYFGADAAEERQVLGRTTSGGVTLGDVLFHVAQEDLPFGGIGPSGMGAYHGREGFATFSHARAVYRQTSFDLMALLGARPPYGKALARSLALRIKK
ncbi:MAG: coniferyl aldehyde dehydrogenase [Pseudomonadota bacterium]